MFSWIHFVWQTGFFFFFFFYFPFIYLISAITPSNIKKIHITWSSRNEKSIYLPNSSEIVCFNYGFDANVENRFQITIKEIYGNNRIAIQFIRIYKKKCIKFFYQ